MKKVLVIRLGAFGDMVIITPLLKALHEDGYQVDVYCKTSSAEIIKFNPFINKVMIHDDSMKTEDLDARYAEISEGYDKVINLSGSIENALVKPEGTLEYDWPQYARHAMCNVNYYDQTMKLGGYEDRKGEIGELYFSKEEEQAAIRFRNKHRGKFLILWALSGSSFHKTYPHAEHIAEAFLNNHPDAMIVNVGDTVAGILEFGHGRVKRYCGIWPIRKSMVMAKYADLVIGPDTGMMHAAGCFDTPKILLLTGVTIENISRYWKNSQVVLPHGADCYPCHRLIYTRDACPMIPGIMAALCASKIPAGQVYLCIEDVYKKWREQRNGNNVLGRKKNLYRGQ